MGNVTTNTQSQSGATDYTERRYWGTGDDEHGKLNEKPWRRLEKGGSWDQSSGDLSSTTRIGILFRKELDVNLMLGPIEAGKSSFINTIASIDKGRPSQVTGTGGAEASMTKKLKLFRPKGSLKNFRLLDTMGVGDTELSGFNIKDLYYIIKGHVKPNYRFDPVCRIDEESMYFYNYPYKKDTIHCVVFVMDANVVFRDNISDTLKMKLQALRNEVKDLDIPIIVLLTKIDVLCELIETDTANCYKSAAMEKAVNLAQGLFCVPVNVLFKYNLKSGSFGSTECNEET